LLFADEPQAVLPKRCGIKVYRYKTTEGQGFREALAFDPKTVEGCLYNQIRDAVKLTTEIAETIPKMGDDSLETIRYPNETLHEIITNAALHRDYSVADDVQNEPALLLEQRGPDDQVCDLGFIFERDEEHAIRGAGTLAHEHEPRERDPPTIPYSAQIGSRQVALGRQVFSEESNRMGA
jgi:hypothetical protein